MIFKTIEDEAGQTSIKLAGIFSRAKENIQAILSKPATTSDFGFADGFNESLSRDILALNEYKAKVNEGVSETEAMASSFREASVAAREYAESVNFDNLSIEQYTVRAKQAQVSTLAQGKSLTSAKQLISEYNTGLKRCGLSQDEYLSAIKQTNPQLAKYLSNVRSGNASVKGYIGSLIGAKAATIGLQIATAALNATISFGISIAISAVVSLIDNLIHREEKIIEKSEQAKDAIQSLTEGFKEDSKTVDEISERYAKLAQKVEDLGKSTQSKGSLTTDEYEEFLDLSNQLAEVFPRLTKGYDDNGNAILSLSGDVDTIVKSLDDLIERQKQLTNQEIVKQLPDLYEGFTVNVSKARQEVKKAQSDFDKFNQTYQSLLKNGTDTRAFDSYGWYKDADGNKIMQINDYLSMLHTLGLEYTETRIPDKVDEVYGTVLSYGTIIEVIGNIDDVATSKLESLRKNLSYAKQNLEAELASIGTYLNTWLQGEWMYASINDKGLQSAVQEMLLHFDPSALPDDVDADNWDAVSEWIRKNILFAIKNIDDAQVAEAIVELFNNDKLSLDDINTFIEKIKEYFGEDSPVYLFIKPKIEELSVGNNYAKDVKKILRDEFDDKVGELSLDDLEIASHLEIPEDTLLTWDELLAKIKSVKEQMNDNKGFKLTDLATSLSNLKSFYEISSKAQNEMASGGLSSDTIKSISDAIDKYNEQFDEHENYLDYLYEENGAIKLNISAWKELSNIEMYGNIQHIEDEIARLKEEEATLKRIKELGEKYNSLVNGNVDYNKRPYISPETMISSGWKDFDGSVATTYTQGMTIGEGKYTYTLDITPILEDGTVLSPEALDEYVQKLVTDNGIEGLLESDEYNLVINVQQGEYDPDYWEPLENKLSDIKDEHYQLVDSAGMVSDKFGDEFTKAIDNNSTALETNQNKLKLYTTLYNDIAGISDAYSEAKSGFAEVKSAIDGISDSLTKVADLQETVANGFTISLDKALEFASVYPEILNGATVAADGQIALNEDVVNAFIEGKEAELKAQIDAKIAELESEKGVLTAKMNFAQAELDLAKSVGKGEGQISQELAEYRVNAGNAVAQALIEAGIDESTAYQLAMAAMSQNSEEFNRIAAQVCTDVDGNFNSAAYSAAQAIYNNMKNASSSLDGIIRAAHNAAAAIAGIGSGTQAGSTGSFSGSGGTTSGGAKITLSQGTFNGVDYSYTPKTVSLDQFISDLELDISSYSSAIAQIDGQIATLKALRNTSLNKFSSSSKKGGSGGSGGSGNKGSGSSSSSKEESWFEQQYKLHQHLLNMDAEEVADYLDWLNDAYQRAYKEGIIDLNDFYKYQEEVYKKLQDLFTDYLNDVEHEIDMRSEFEGESKKIISLYKKLIADVEKEIKAARAAGLDDTDDYIQELQKKWASYRDSIKEIEDDVKDNAKDAVDELIDIRIKMLKQDIDNEKDAIKKKLDYLKDFYQKQKDMLQEVYDEEKYLEEQSEKRKTVADIQAELAQLEYDNSAWAQKRKLQLAEELADAQKDLDDFERDHALQVAQDELDKLYELQEKELDAQTELLEAKENDAKALYEQALADIKNGSIQLYEEMIEWNNTYGDGISDTIKTAWEEAYKALQDYKDLYGTLYEGVNLANATGYTKPKESWDNAPVSGTNPSNGTSSGSSSGGSKSSGSSTTSTPKLDDATKRKVAAAIWNGGYGWGHNPDRAKRLTEVFGANNGIQDLVNKGVGKNDAAPGSAYTYLNMRKKFKGYWSGTRKAVAGLHAIDELGTETIFQSADGTKYKMFTGGEKVLNAKASNFLYDFANKGSEILDKIIRSFFGGGIGGITPPMTNNEIKMGDIYIEGNATSQTVSEIRRAQRDSLTYMLKELGKLNK